MVYNCIIIGAGPAGLMAQTFLNTHAILLEKNAKIGKKLSISGNGQCNFTHIGSISELLNAYGKAKNWLKKSIYNFDNKATIDFMSKNGVESSVRDDGKVFPASLNSADIIAMFKRVIPPGNIRLGNQVEKIEKVSNIFFIETNKGLFKAKKLLISTGGLSYPATGSEGDGYNFAKVFGHSISSPKPALSTVIPENYQFRNISGTAIKNVELSSQKKKFHGDLLFTHNWLSGPVIIDNSHHFEPGMTFKLNFLKINEKELHQNLHKIGNLKSYLKQTEITKRMASILFTDNLLSQNIANISKKEFREISDKLLRYEIEIKEIGGFEQAMATSGGVSLQEVNSKTMESRLCKNLYFAGEVLDYVGVSGGYNIQAAFSTAFTAAKSIIKEEA